MMGEQKSEVGGRVGTTNGSATRPVIRSFRDLEVWQRSMTLLRPIHDLTLKFPDYEKFDLGSQIRRACKSVPANIAEGYAKRRSSKEFRAYLTTAMGSATEMEVHLEIAQGLGYVSADDARRFIAEYQVIARQLYRLIEKWRSIDLRPPTSDLRHPEAER
jgi:four helix bundle protein